MGKVKIGILPTSRLFENDNPYDDKYTFVNSYCKMISENGGLPVGILLNDGKLDCESLEMCDAFMLCGGNKMQPYMFEAIRYALENNKPLLGVCLGMQTIALFSYLESELRERNLPLNYENLMDLFKEIKEANVYFLKPIEGHYNSVITRDEYEQNKHVISLNKDSLLYDIYQADSLDVLSMHSYISDLIGDGVLINCTDENGVLEGVEYNNKDLFIVGVQWHPEIEEKHNLLFKRLVKEAEKRR